MLVHELPVLGAELTGLDLSESMDSQTEQSIRDAFAKYDLLLIRAPTLDTNEHYRLMDAIGEILNRNAEYVSNDKSESIAPQDRLLFHSDRCFGIPPYAISLWAESISASSSPTQFVSAVRAYEALDDSDRKLIGMLHGVHIFSSYYPDEVVRMKYDTLPAGATYETFPRALHPLVRGVLNSDRKAIFVNEHQTSHIAEMPGAEGEELIQKLFGVLYDAPFVYTHNWTVGDLLVWNNLAVQHGRPAALDNNPRRMRRFSLSSPHSDALVGDLPTAVDNYVRRRYEAPAGAPAS